MPTDIKRIICAGMRRAGSTWQYNAARLICGFHGRSTWAGFEDAWRPNKQPYQIVKTHKWRPGMLFGATHSMGIYRDVRDVAASAVRRNLCGRTPSEVMAWLLQTVPAEFCRWEPHVGLVQRYEVAMKRPLESIEQIADYLGLKVHVRRVAWKLSTLQPTKAKVDPLTLLHPDHFTDGRTGTWTGTLTDDTVRAIEAVFGGWLNERGYKCTSLPT